LFGVKIIKAEQLVSLFYFRKISITPALTKILRTFGFFEFTLVAEKFEKSPKSNYNALFSWQHSWLLFLYQQHKPASQIFNEQNIE